MYIPCISYFMIDTFKFYRIQAITINRFNEKVFPFDQYLWNYSHLHSSRLQPTVIIKYAMFSETFWSLN